MEQLQQILSVLPQPYRQAVQRHGLEQAEEIRLRVGRLPMVTENGRERGLPMPTGYDCVRQSELEQIVMAASDRSGYTTEDCLREGYLPLPGGHRLGVCGTAAVRSGDIRTLRNLSSVSLRIARAIPCAPEREIGNLRGSALILGPPGSGKTTLLRDCIRLISDSGQRVSLVDERCEVAACADGAAQFDVGAHTDVLSACRKSTGIMMMVRTMNPVFVAVDEITTPDDLEAMEQCSYCGVLFLATAHAASADELYRRPLYRKLMELGIFRSLMILDRDRHLHMEAVAECSRQSA